MRKVDNGGGKWGRKKVIMEIVATNVDVSRAPRLDGNDYNADARANTIIG